MVIQIIIYISISQLKHTNKKVKLENTTNKHPDRLLELSNFNNCYITNLEFNKGDTAIDNIDSLLNNILNASGGGLLLNNIKIFIYIILILQIVNQHMVVQ